MRSIERKWVGSSYILLVKQYKSLGLSFVSAVGMKTMDDEAEKHFIKTFYRPPDM